MVTNVVGSDATKPNLGVIFTVNTAAPIGDTSGSAILSCR